MRKNRNFKAKVNRIKTMLEMALNFKAAVEAEINKPVKPKKPDTPCSRKTTTALEMNFVNYLMLRMKYPAKY